MRKGPQPAMISKIISTFLNFAQVAILASAVAIGVVWTISPLRTFIQNRYSWLDAGALLGALIAGLALLLTILGKLSKRLDALEEAIRRLTDATGLNAIIIPDDQYGTMERCKHIQSNKPRKTRLIEMSGDTVDKELMTLLENKIPTELLLMHPSAIKLFPRAPGTDISEFKTSLKNHLGRLIHCRSKLALFPEKDKLKVLYYQTVPGFRGRLIGERIELSWYCFREDQEWAIVLGHCNPTVVADINTAGGQSLLKIFDASFRAMSNFAVDLSNDEWEEAIEDVEKWIQYL